MLQAQPTYWRITPSISIYTTGLIYCSKEILPWTIAKPFQIAYLKVSVIQINHVQLAPARYPLGVFPEIALASLK